MARLIATRGRRVIYTQQWAVIKIELIAGLRIGATSPGERVGEYPTRYQALVKAEEEAKKYFDNTPEAHTLIGLEHLGEVAFGYAVFKNKHKETGNTPTTYFLIVEERIEHESE